MIQYGKQSISEEDIDAVLKVLKSDFLTQGPKVPEFESSLCEYTKAKYALATNSATSALHIACKALDLSKGDWLWTSPISFVASANCGLYCGASVDFVDIELNSYNMDPIALQKKLEVARQKNMLPKVLVVVHLCGNPCNMREIKVLSKEFGFKIIEDASHAVGSEYENRKIGSCQYSDISIFSFHPVKIITTAEGGAALTNNKRYAEKMELYRSHGITKRTNCFLNKPDGPWYYEQQLLGFNYRMNDLQAALGISQLERLDEFVKKRNQIAETYNLLFEDLPVVTPDVINSNLSSYHLYVIRLKLEEIKPTRLNVFTDLLNSNIGVNIHYIPIYRQPIFSKIGFKKSDFPKAEQYYREALTLPVFPGLKHEQQLYIFDQVKMALKKN